MCGFSTPQHDAGIHTNIASPQQHCITTASKKQVVLSFPDSVDWVQPCIVWRPGFSTSIMGARKVSQMLCVRTSSMSNLQPLGPGYTTHFWPLKFHKDFQAITQISQGFRLDPMVVIWDSDLWILYESMTPKCLVVNSPALAFQIKARVSPIRPNSHDHVHCPYTAAG